MPPSDRPDVPGLADERAGDLVPAARSLEEERSTLGELVMAVMQFAAHSREAAEVVDDLFETGRIRAILRWSADATTDDDLFDLLEGTVSSSCPTWSPVIESRRKFP